MKQKSLDALYSNIPKKKLESAKPIDSKESIVETKDEDLFDNESEEEEDIIAVSSMLYVDVDSKSLTQFSLTCGK